MLSVFKRAEQYDQRLALIDKDQSYSYEDLIKASNTIASALLSEKSDLYEERIGFLIPHFIFRSLSFHRIDFSLLACL